MMNLAELEARYPYIHWSEPIHVVTPDGAGYACRVCVANQGLSSNDVKNLFQTDAAAIAHITQEHPGSTWSRERR
jgi:hypothetical protein